MDKLMEGLTISIATRGRSEFLPIVLQDLISSKVDHIEIDILVDGFDDRKSFEAANDLAKISKNPIRVFQFEKSGLSSIRNKGADLARYSFIRLQDDDDGISARSIERIRDFHAENQNQNLALLTNTTVEASVLSPLMEFITGEGGMLFGYSRLQRGVLDYSGFWGGRVSLSTELLRRIRFDEELVFGAEDIEFSYRASSVGLSVFFEPDIAGEMIRQLSTIDFVLRSYSQGYSNSYLASKYKGEELEDWATAFTDYKTFEISCNLSLLINAVKHAQRFEDLTVNDLASLLGEDWRLYLSWIWSAIYRFSKNLGFEAYKLGFGREEVLSKLLKGLEL
jgi:glycosyltransferase involved in cell wall biosynthesis